jgi:hypothetical protein
MFSLSERYCLFNESIQVMVEIVKHLCLLFLYFTAELYGKICI